MLKVGLQMENRHFYKVGSKENFMIDYNELYEMLRKEKYSEPLQPIPKAFVQQVSEYLNEKKWLTSKEGDLFSENALKAKKQLENTFLIFKELILRRKKKILNLVFVAAETGVMKRDFDNMLQFEKDLFEKIVKALEESDRELDKSFSGGKIKDDNKMIMFEKDVEQFLDMNGNLVGPFMTGELSNLDAKVSEILVSSGKARFVDEE